MSRTDSDLLGKLASIKRWSRGGERAPHKPLLLLLALGRVQRGEDRLVKFEEIEIPLKNLLMEYGPSRKSYHAEFPFWHLRSDGLWEIPGEDLLTPKKGGSSPTVGSLRENVAEGGMPVEYHDMLRNDPALLSHAVETILNSHFPSSMHEELLNSVGLSDECPASLADASYAGLPDDNKPKRDPNFRPKVLLAYNWTCAVCGFTGSLENAPFGLEAAHVKWHSHNGPSTVDNGLCLCPLHHKALDRGVIGLSDDLTVMVSQKLNENEHTEKMFFDFTGAELRGPRKGQPPVSSDYSLWHRENCFRE